MSITLSGISHPLFPQAVSHDGKAAQSSPAFHFAVNRGPRVLVQVIAFILGFYSSYLKEALEIVSFCFQISVPPPFGHYTWSYAGVLSFKGAAGRSQWQHGLRRRSPAARLLRLWVRIPPGAWMFVCCDCCVLSGRGLCDELITRLERSPTDCGASLCDLETSWMRRSWLTGGCRTKNKQAGRGEVTSDSCEIK